MIPTLIVVGGISLIIYTSLPKPYDPVPTTYSEWYLEELEEKKRKAAFLEKQKEIEEDKKTEVLNPPNWILGRWKNKFDDVYHFYENGNIYVSEQYQFTIPKTNIKRQRVKNGNVYIINLKNGKEYKFTLISENKIDYKSFTLVKF